MKFPNTTTLDQLKENFEVVFCSQGPTDNGWKGHYLECPECNELVQKSGCQSCKCNNIFVDGDMLRVIVENGQEEKVKTYYAYKKE